jgi:hypothetical protein
MLIRYLLLEKNQTFFVVTLFCASAPSCIMAPFFVFDHDKCIQKNYMIDLTFSVVIQMVCLTVILSIVAMGFIYITITLVVLYWIDKG